MLLRIEAALPLNDKVLVASSLLCLTSSYVSIYLGCISVDIGLRVFVTVQDAAGKLPVSSGCTHPDEEIFYSPTVLHLAQ